MRNSFGFGTVAAALFVLPLLTVTPAHAGIAACGNIDVEANASCELKAKGCEVSCTPVSVQAACAVKGEVSCEGSCPKVPSLDCTASCTGSCAADCKVKPAEYDCATNCKADASAKCDAKCSAAGDKAQCQASCQATFSANCETSCKGTQGSVDCDAVCKGRCEGSCTAQTNLECQVSCQSDLAAKCEADVKGGCEADCSDAGGALFCNGQYVDHNGSLQDCIDALKTTLNITVTASGTSSGNCTDNVCTGEAQGSAAASCAFSPRGATGGDVASGFALFAAIGAVFMRRRRQQKSA
ncbi:MAG: hypothetical protein ABJB12_08270 [Pseudomonadota bacterium]